MPEPTILKVKEVTKTFGGLVALSEIDFTVNPTEILGIIGPNGAGKTTLFNIITGLYKSNKGDVLFGKFDESINDLQPYQITKKGIARTFQNIRLFKNMTAIENVMIGRQCRIPFKFFPAIFRTRAMKREERRIMYKSLELMEFVGLSEMQDILAMNLSYGDQRRLEIARALATDPQLLCLDEPAAGMNPNEVKKLGDLIKKIRREGITVLLIEHHMRLVMDVCDRIVVLDYGKKIADDAPGKIRANPTVIKAYLGKDYEAEVVNDG